MKRLALFAVIPFALTSCSSLPTAPQVSAGAATANSYETAVRNACAIAKTAAAGAALLIPSVATAAVLVKSGCDSESAIAALVLSPESVAWVNTLIATLKSNGKVVPPAPLSTAAAASTK